MADYEDLPYVVVERRSAGISPFVWGALIGAGLALLYAPRAGKELRRELRNGIQRLRDTAEGTVRQVQDTLTDTFDDLRDQVSDRVDTARRAVDAGRAAARRTRAALDRRVREAESGAEAPPEPAREPADEGEVPA